VSTGSIDNAKRIYWDIRPHPFYPTIEFRACDLPTKVRETTVVALIQCLCTRFLALHRRNMSLRVWPRNLVVENVYRAYRYGVSGDFLDLPTRRTVPFRDVMRQLLDDLAEEIRLLHCENEIAEIYRIIEHGNSADRQRAVYAATGSLDRVVDHVVAETCEGVV
jgi:carboxylate-amine ligase